MQREWCEWVFRVVNGLGDEAKLERVRKFIENASKKELETLLEFLMENGASEITLRIIGTLIYVHDPTCPETK